ncbi:MAG: MerR family transcriptional regulator [Oscillospiraceae bacterium]|nr:MerR family transcriptional regulator [Oscillospiraceae bacterium]
MNIRQCDRCSKIFNFQGNRRCPACVREVDQSFVDVRNFLDESPKASIEEVCEETGVDEADLLGWLREGRLILSSANVSALLCGRCHAPITSGRYCENCAVWMKATLEDTAHNIKQTSEKGARSHVYIQK